MIEENRIEEWLMRMVQPVPLSRACTYFAMTLVSPPLLWLDGHSAWEPPGLHLP